MKNILLLCTALTLTLGSCVNLPQERRVTPKERRYYKERRHRHYHDNHYDRRHHWK